MAVTKPSSMVRPSATGCSLRGVRSRRSSSSSDIGGRITPAVAGVATGLAGRRVTQRPAVMARLSRSRADPPEYGRRLEALRKPSLRNPEREENYAARDNHSDEVMESGGEQNAPRAASYRRQEGIGGRFGIPLSRNMSAILSLYCCEASSRFHL
jgi:hypothetical protein